MSQEMTEGLRSTRYPKSARLHHKTLVDGLFAQGQSLYSYPLRLVWRKLGTEELEGSYRHGVPEGIGQVQAMTVVPKKKQRHAVDRVRLRRRMREAYRLNREELLKQASQQEDLAHLAIAFIYMADKDIPYSTIEHKMRKLLGELIQKL